MMNKEDGRIVHAVRRQWAEALRVLSARGRQARGSRRRAEAEIELVLDDLRAEGIDPASPLGRECLARIIAKRIDSTDGNEWPKVWRDLEF